MAQGTAGAVTPSSVWLPGVHRGMQGPAGSGLKCLFELSLSGHPEPAADEFGWGEPALGEIYYHTWQAPDNSLWQWVGRICFRIS